MINKNMNVEMLKAQLNKNVEIIEATFSNEHLQLLGYGFCGIMDELGWMELLLEIATMPGEAIDDDIKLKANFYDEDGVIIYSDESDIYADEFSGYDTIKISLHENNLAFNTVKCRIFVTRSIY